MRYEAVGGLRRFRFILLEFYIFRGSELGNALPLNLPWFLLPISLAIHVVESRALSLLDLPCYFVRLGTKIVGLFAVQEERGSLVIASLGVVKGYRRLGIGTCILRHVETSARLRGKSLLKVDVYRGNVPAQRFYTKYGFSFARGGGMRNLAKGSKRVDAPPPT